MTRIRSQVIWSIGLLAVVGVAVSGCPKQPRVQGPQPPAVATTPGAGADAGGAAGPGSAGSGAIGTQPGGAGSAQPGAGGTGAGTASGGAGTVPAPGGAGSPATTGPGGAGPGSTAPGGAGSPGTEAAARPASPATGTTVPTLPSPGEFVETTGLKDIHFDFDRSDIRPPDQAILDQSAAWLKANAKALVLIEGHCDERGTNEYNLALGDRRAKATRDYLTAAGIPASRITTISYGEERPQCTEHTEECWARNRRAHFLVKP